MLLGPELGEDACAVEIPAGVLIVAADPITLTGADVGRYAVVVNANDVAVMGAAPRWFPRDAAAPARDDRRKCRGAVHRLARALAQVGPVLVGGHSEVTNAGADSRRRRDHLGDAPGVPVRHDRRSVPGRHRGAGRAVPVEGATVLATGRVVDWPPSTKRSCMPRRGRSTNPASASSTPPCWQPTSANAMHDPTEGGLASGLHELAVASGLLGARRSKAFALVRARARGVTLGADPWATLASGCLLATFPQPVADVAVARLAERFDAAMLGRVETGRGVYDETGGEIAWPERDEVARILEQ